MITPFCKDRSGREGMTVVSVLLGAAVEVGVGSNPTIAKYHLYFSIIYFFRSTRIRNDPWPEYLLEHVYL